VQRWNLPDGWVISARPAHPPLVTEADFIAAQQIRAARGPAPRNSSSTVPGERRYLLAGLLTCGTCRRRMEPAWSNGKAAYRVPSRAHQRRRPGSRTAEERLHPRGPDAGAPAGAALAADPGRVPQMRGRRTRHGIDVRAPLARKTPSSSSMRTRSPSSTTRPPEPCGPTRARRPRPSSRRRANQVERPRMKGENPPDTRPGGAYAGLVVRHA
jgi:hypothetical protein